MSKHKKRENVIQVWLSEYHSLDIVRLPKSRRYRVVFAERFGVQRRAFVELSFDQALVVARFFASISTLEEVEDPTGEFDEPTKPGRPEPIVPEEVLELIQRYGRDED